MGENYGITFYEVGLSISWYRYFACRPLWLFVDAGITLS
jgi:hypothetical protein